MGSGWGVFSEEEGNRVEGSGIWCEENLMVCGRNGMIYGGSGLNSNDGKVFNNLLITYADIL